MYLIYETQMDAIARADEEGKRMNLSYWIEGKGTRWLTEPDPTADGKWALDVETYELDEAEEATTVTTFEPKPIPEEEM